MKAVVVYESLWGNTAQVARAVAEGIGDAAVALTTDQATAAAVQDADLIVAGAPLLGFDLATDQMRRGIGANPGNGPTPPDLAHPSMRSWLDALPAGHGAFATFETRIWWSPGSAAKKIAAGLQAKGYRPAMAAEKFIVTGRYGPLKAGEIERARSWGSTLARSLS